jgi:hypothetical protein
MVDMIASAASNGAGAKRLRQQWCLVPILEATG